ncbi:hypothetical protein [Pseudomonas sp. A-R-19]|uniref:hypothetical protein n=1 Tax=Pseudomonas sp. A-R-19 TaxID=2832403 RepID=UPI001CBD6BAB|nr:hypothetical protein [Pseudomonas sp. A-R-19]
MKNEKLKWAREPNLEGLSQLQRDHVMRVFPETRATMADYLRQGVDLYIYRQDEVPEVPPFALAVVQDPAYWIECVESERSALALAAKLGLNVASVDPPAPCGRKQL